MDSPKMILNNLLNITYKDYMTLQEIADDFGVSHQRIVQIERRALNKLAKRLKEHDLNLHDLELYFKYLKKDLT
jgi:DNA-directed RNA polymerase sigma subunit (sigma70/sigma32)